MKECDQNCNECKVIQDPNWTQMYMILARIVQWDEESRNIIERACPNATGCPECHMDLFVHSEHCSIGQALDAEIEEETPPCDHAWERVKPTNEQLDMHLKGHAQRCKKCHQREWVAE